MDRRISVVDFRDDNSVGRNEWRHRMSNRDTTAAHKRSFLEFQDGTIISMISGYGTYSDDAHIALLQNGTYTITNLVNIDALPTRGGIFAGFPLSEAPDRGYGYCPSRVRRR